MEGDSPVARRIKKIPLPTREKCPTKRRSELSGTTRTGDAILESQQGGTVALRTIAGRTCAELDCGDGQHLQDDGREADD